ncbi:MAG: NADH-quinone oxidoreductase subunit L [bacterium]|nr:NADH-quinone oxidoreductase subunit L [bacterium]
MTTESYLPLTGIARFAWAIPLLPFLAFIIISFITRRWGKISAGVAILGLLGSLGGALGILFQRLSAPQAPPMQISFPWISLLPNTPLGVIELGLLVDNLSAFMLTMVCFIGLCIQIYSVAYMSAEIPHFPTQGSASMSRFFGWLSLFMFSMLGLVLANNLLQTYIFWELVGLCSYLLIGFWYFKTSAAHASKKAFIVTRFGDLGLLMGILLLGIALQRFDFVGITDTLSTNAGQINIGLLTLAGLLIFCGAVGKSAQFPLHIWLPDAMEGPTPVSALIHAATMVAAGIYLVARIFPVFHPAGIPTSAAMAVAFIGAITAFVAATIAVVQNDIKKVLAYSTISQLGFMMTALGIGAYTAGTFHLFTHAFFKALLFLGSGAVIVACHSNDMWHMGGLRKALPCTWFAFLMGCLALAGIPPFAGFWSKDEILTSVSLINDTPAGMALYILLSLATFLTAFYVTRLYFITFEGKFRGMAAPADLQGQVPAPTLPPPAATSLSLGFQPQWTEDKAQKENEARRKAKQRLLPPACLGCYMEHAAHSAHPHEVSPLMWLPLLTLSLFAIGLGFIGIPEGISGAPSFYEAHIYPSTPVVHDHDFTWAPMIFSVAVSLLGIFASWLLYGRDAMSGERKLRSKLGKLAIFLQQKWYMDHIWAKLLSYTMYAGANIAEFFDNYIFDGIVNGCARLTKRFGEILRQEHSGYVQNYLFIIVVALVVLAIAIGYIEPGFVTSPVYWSKLLQLQ